MYNTSTTTNYYSIFESESDSVTYFHMHKLTITFSVGIQALKMRPSCGLETSGKKHTVTKYRMAEE